MTALKPRFGQPTSVMLDGLGSLGITMREAAGILLSPENHIVPTSEEETKRDRFKLTRKWKQAQPGKLKAEEFNSFSDSIPQLASLGIQRLRESRETEARATSRTSSSCRTVQRLSESRETGGMTAAEAATALLAILTGKLSLAMQRALQNYDLAPDAYDNAIDGIMAAPGLIDRQRAELALMMFTVTGCLSDPLQAIEVTDAYARKRHRMSLLAERTPAGTPESHRPMDDEQLCLLRLTGDHAIGWRHTLEPTRDGTVIGTAPDAETPGSMILDVDRTVSPEHLRIYLQKGRWYALGMYSANGTALTREGTGETILVEPPAEKQGPDYEPQPVELFPGDTLNLGSTVFRVLRFNRGE